MLLNLFFRYMRYFAGPIVVLFFIILEFELFNCLKLGLLFRDLSIGINLTYMTEKYSVQSRPRGRRQHFHSFVNCVFRDDCRVTNAIIS